MNNGHHTEGYDLEEVYTITLDVLLDIMQDEEATIKNRLDAAWTVAQLVAPHLERRPFRRIVPSDKVGTHPHGFELPDNPMDSGDTRARS